MTKMPFIAKRNRTKECLELVNTNVCVKLLDFIHREGMSTSLFFIDEYSRFGYVYLTHRNLMPQINSLNLKKNWITY